MWSSTSCLQFFILRRQQETLACWCLRPFVPCRYRPIVLIDQVTFRTTFTTRPKTENHPHSHNQNKKRTSKNKTMNDNNGWCHGFAFFVKWFRQHKANQEFASHHSCQSSSLEFTTVFLMCSVVQISVRNLWQTHSHTINVRKRSAA